MQMPIPLFASTISKIEAQLPPLVGSSGERSVLRGTEAQLQALKSIYNNTDLASSSNERPSKAQKVEGVHDYCWTRENLDNIDQDKECLIFALPEVSMVLVINGETVNSSEGCVLLSTHRIIFAASSDDCQDLSIDSTCVILHAMTSDPETSIYCQLSPNSLNVLPLKTLASDDVEGVEALEDDHDCAISNHSDGPIEIFFSPLCRSALHDHAQQVKLCEEFFKALGILAGLNPSYDDQDDIQDSGFFDATDIDMDPYEMNDFVCRLDNITEDEVATEDERNAMLERLDAVLTVPPDYEQYVAVRDGRFDDAEETEDLL